MRKFSFLLMVAFLCFEVGTVLAQKKHTVVSGNTLSGLAKQYYNDGKKWKTIYDANKGKDLEIASVADSAGKVVKRRVPTRLVNPNLIYPGQVLVIPDVADDGKGLMTDEQKKTAITGTWEGVEPAPLKGAFVKYDADGSVSAYDPAAGEFVKGPDKWSVAGNKLMIGKETYTLDEAALKGGMLQFADASTTYKLKKGSPAPKVQLYTVAGTVTSNGAPLSGVKVDYTKDGKAMSVMTDASGKFSVADVPTGTRLSMSKDGYVAQTASTTNANAVNVDMKPNKPANETREIVGRVNYVKKEGKEPVAAKKATVTLTVDGKVQVADMAVKSDGTFSFPGVKYDFGQKVQITAKMKKFKDGSVSVADEDKPKVAAPAINLTK